MLAHCQVENQPALNVGALCNGVGCFCIDAIDLNGEFAGGKEYVFSGFCCFIGKVSREPAASVIG